MEAAYARIAAAKKVLEAVRTSSLYTQHARNQAGSLKFFFQSLTVSSTDIASLVVAVTDLGLPADLATELIQELGQLDAYKVKKQFTSRVQELPALFLQRHVGESHG